MKLMNQYLAEYADSHQNKMNQIIHKICVPLIMFSIFGMLDSIPFNFSLAYCLIVFSLGFYLITKTPVKLLVGMLIQSVLMIVILKAITMPMKLYLSIGIFVVAWIFQFIGHHLEGKRPSFLKDVLFLLIGPVWVVKYLIEKFN